MKNSDQFHNELEILLEFIWSFVPCKVLYIAIISGLFDRIDASDEGSTNKDLAYQMGWSEPVLDSFIQILASTGFLLRVDNKQTLSSLCKKWFLRSSDQYIGDFVIRSNLLEIAYDDFIPFSSRGKPVPAMLNETKAAFGEDKTITESFVQSMHAMTSEFTEKLVASLDLRNCNEILDVGAGRGTLSVALVEANQNLHCDLFDLPGVINHASDYVRRRHLELRCTTYESDWNDWDWSRKYGCILLSQVLHEMTIKEQSLIISNSARSLHLNGLVVVINTAPKDAVQSLLGSIFSLNMVVELGTVTPTISWLESEYSKHGIQRLDLIGLPGARVAWIGTNTSQGD